MTDLFGNEVPELFEQPEMPGLEIDPLDGLRETARQASQEYARRPDDRCARQRAGFALKAYLRARDGLQGRGMSLEEVAADLRMGDPEELDPMVRDLFTQAGG